MSLLPQLQDVYDFPVRYELAAVPNYDNLYSMMDFMLIGAIIFVVLFALLQYVYLSLTLMLTARKLKLQPAWIAWIPFAADYLKAKGAKMHWWPILLNVFSVVLMVSGALAILFNVRSNPEPFLTGPDNLPYFGSAIFIILIGLALAVIYTVYRYIWEYKICVARKRPGWWALITLIPLVVSIVFIPLKLVPVIGIGFSFLEYIVSLAAAVWHLVMWGILAWSN